MIHEIVPLDSRVTPVSVALDRGYNIRAQEREPGYI